MGPSVYLLKTVDDNRTLYKIGYTKKSIYSRIRSLQTGCPRRIELCEVFESGHARKIEIALHNIFSSKQTNGEWFELDFLDELNFKPMCEKMEKTQDILTACIF